MVKPGGTGRPRLAISARPAPLPPRGLRMSARPSALPLPKPKTHFDLAGALAEGFLGGAFAAAAGLRGAAVPAGPLVIVFAPPGADLVIGFTESGSPGAPEYWPPCRRKGREFTRRHE